MGSDTWGLVRGGLLYIYRNEGLPMVVEMKSEKEMHEEERRLALMETESIPKWEKEIKKWTQPKKTFETHNDISINSNGTCLQGYINAHYYDLLETFGEPTESDGYKVDAEWRIEFEDGTVATIYNWKNGPNYCGADGTPVEYITEWNVGGKNGTSPVSDIGEVLNAKILYSQI